MKVKELLRDYKDEEFYSTDFTFLKKLWEDKVIAYKKESFLIVFLVKSAISYKSFIAIYRATTKNIPLSISYTKLISSFKLEDFFKMVKDLTIINEKEYEKALKLVMLKNL